MLRHASELRRVQLRPRPLRTRLSEPQGFIAEPGLVERAVIFNDRRLGSGDLSGGWRFGVADLIPGAGSISGQAAYRRWGSNDRYVVEASAGLSMRRYKAVAGRFEVPQLAQGRMAIGTEFRWQDYTQIGYFGQGPDALETNASQYRLRSSNLVGYVTLRPTRWMDIDAGVGVLRPTFLRVAGPFKRDRPETSAMFGGDPVFSLAEQPTFVTSRISLTADTRDFPGHPLRGGVIHVAATRYSDRDDGDASFRSYQADVARFIPVAGGVSCSRYTDDSSAPARRRDSSFRSICSRAWAASNSLRSYADYRFHDRNLLGRQRRDPRRHDDARGRGLLRRCRERRAARRRSRSRSSGRMAPAFGCIRAGRRLRASTWRTALKDGEPSSD